MATRAGTAHDLVIRGGQVADGLGGDPFEADVAVSGGTITAVGAVPGEDARSSTRPGCSSRLGSSTSTPTTTARRRGTPA